MKYNCLFALYCFPSLGYPSDCHGKLKTEIQRAVEGSQPSWQDVPLVWEYTGKFYTWGHPYGSCTHLTLETRAWFTPHYVPWSLGGSAPVTGSPAAGQCPALPRPAAGSGGDTQPEQQCHPSDACLGWRPLLLLPNSGNMRCHCIHPQPRARLYTCWTCPAAQYSSDTTMSMLWHRQASGASHDCAWAACHCSASAALGEGYWDLRGYLVTMGTLKHLPPGGTGSGFRA